MIGEKQKKKLIEMNKRNSIMVPFKSFNNQAQDSISRLIRESSRDNKVWDEINIELIEM